MPQGWNGVIFSNMKHFLLYFLTMEKKECYDDKPSPAEFNHIPYYYYHYYYFTL